jgi:hypothetical protein
VALEKRPEAPAAASASFASTNDDDDGHADDDDDDAAIVVASPSDGPTAVTKDTWDTRAISSSRI